MLVLFGRVFNTTLPKLKVKNCLVCFSEVWHRNTSG